MNILITSVGRRSYMVEYFREAMNGVGKIHTANSEMSYAMSIADRCVITPNIYDVIYIDFLLEYCKLNSIKLLISLFDIDLPILSKNKSKFEEIGTQVIVSDVDVVEMCNDKWLSYQFLSKRNFDTPRSFITLSNCLEALDKSELFFPLIVKPRWGMGSIGVFEADDKEELKILYNKTEKAISNSYLKYESGADINQSVIIQEKLTGDEYGIDIFNDLHGNYLSSVPKRKIAMRAGETDIAEVQRNDALSGLGKNLSQAIRHIANLDVDCFFKDGRYYILEMNCRFGGQYPFSHLAGVHFPKLIVEMYHKKKIDDKDLHFEPVTGFKDLIIRKIK